MPSGLDGHLNPISTTQRSSVLDTVADLVASQHERRTLVGIDGRPDSGKSTFADELASRLEHRGISTIRSTTDSFHRPRIERMQRGVRSPEGYYFDSHQLGRIVEDLLKPFRSGSPQVLVAAFDEPSDRAIERIAEVEANALLVFDGLFLHRPELEPLWNVSVFLDADQRRDEEWLDFLLASLPAGPVERAAELDRRLDEARWPRYRRGWRSYAADLHPMTKASVLIDNNDISHPRILAVR